MKDKFFSFVSWQGIEWALKWTGFIGVLFQLYEFIYSSITGKKAKELKPVALPIYFLVYFILFLVLTYYKIWGTYDGPSI